MREDPASVLADELPVGLADAEVVLANVVDSAPDADLGPWEARGLRLPGSTA